MPTSEDKPLLTLTEAANRLGVHPATLRRWSDKGQIAVVVTPGGHRRFPVSEIERLAAKRSLGPSEALPQRFADAALTHTREEIAELGDERWLTSMNDEERAAKRELGRRLMGLMMQYIASEDDEHQSSLLEEAEAIGTQYGQDLHTAGLPLTDALQATMFFRDNIVESAVMLPSSVRQRPESNKRLLRRINEFLNAMQLAIATAYDPSDE